MHVSVKVKDAYEEIKKYYKRGSLDSPDFPEKFERFKKIISGAILSRNEKLFWSSRVLIFEIEDYLGIERHNPEWEKEFRLFAENPEAMATAETLEEEELSILKSKVRCAIAGVHLIYSQHKYEQALEETRKLERFLKAHLHNESSKRFSHGLLGMLKYTQGKIFRQLNSYDAAIECFNDSILAYHERLISRSNVLRDADEIKSEQSFSLVRIAWAMGFGLGFTHFTRGDLVNAQFMVVSALTTMLRHGYVIHQNNLKILKSSIRRATIASHKDLSKSHKLELSNLAADVGKCLEVFRRKDRKSVKGRYNKYQIRALYELSLIGYYLAITAATEDEEKEIRDNLLTPNLEELIKLADKDLYWKAQAIIIKSHFLCHQNKLNEALACAEESVVSNSGILPVSDEALLLKGKIHFLLGSYREAESLFKQALEKAKTNPRIKVTALLRLIDCAFRQNEYSKGLKIWETIQPEQKEFQYAYLKEAFEDMQNEIDELKNHLLIFNANEGLNWEICTDKLKGWLYRQAEQQAYGKQTEMKKLLGADEDTFKKWKGLS
jgi:tetratricopeptide (TPR) repeat protein